MKDRLAWLNRKRGPYFYVPQDPHPLIAPTIRRRFELYEEFRIPTTDFLVVPDPKGNGQRLCANVSEKLSEDDTYAAIGLMTCYWNMVNTLFSDQASGDFLSPLDKGTDRPVELTARQLEVLSWAAAGKTLQDIADITGLKRRTVRFHLEQARERYGFATSQQTIVRAALDYGFDPLGPNRR